MNAAQAPRFRLIETTLREGEQCEKAAFRTQDKIEIARALDAFGVDAIEVTSPAASPLAQREAALVARLPLYARVLAHCRCMVDDVRVAVDTGVSGIGLFYATSRILRESSHGASIQQILDAMGPPIELALSAGLEVRFSAEDAFRSDEAELLDVYRAAEALGVQRVGVTDTVGIATPRQVYALVRAVRRHVATELGFHGHDDTGCAIANAHEAVAAGATHVDVSVLGIGERVGITPLGGFVARMYSLDPQGVASRYRLGQLREVERLVARVLGVPIPWNNLVTGETAFSHRAGMHLKAMVQNPGSYEVIPPEAFGLSRKLVASSRAATRSAVGYRAREEGVVYGAGELRAVTRRIKAMCDAGELCEDDLERMLRDWMTA
jgi:homocitrate synthase